jgi:hypothetical protein
MTVRRFSVRAAGAVATAGALLAVSAGSASAHECYVANRSAQGNASVAEHSAAWTSFTLSFVVTQFLGQTQEVADCVVAAAPGAGVPTMFVVGGKQAVGSGGVIMENNPNAARATDGHGIDHAEDVYGATIVGLVLGCGGSLPG